MKKLIRILSYWAWRDELMEREAMLDLCRDYYRLLDQLTEEQAWTSRLYDENARLQETINQSSAPSAPAPDAPA